MVIFFFSLLRQLEVWLHQHIFKVGWLVTKNYQTTTILYYTFFIPGVALYEFVIWLIAGLLNVRAERSFNLPEKQEIGELRLNFVKLSRKTTPYKAAIINISPLIFGIAIIWFVANYVINIQDALSLMNDGTLNNLDESIRQLTLKPDFWLWIYIMFTVTNTMMPDQGVIRLWLRGGAFVIIALGVIFLFGANTLVNDEIFSPFISGLNALSSVFAFMIALNVFGVAILAIIENTIEWITGDSATFKDGKMITLSREEAKAMRLQQRQKDLQLRQQQKRSSLTAGPPSVYKLELPIPAAPGESEPLTQRPTRIISSTDEPLVIEPPSRQREEPRIITGIARPSREEEATEAKPDKERFVINTPRSNIDVDEVDEDDGDFEDDEDTGTEDDETLSYEDFEDPA
ncbi:MAG: hypothetical protein RLP44_02970 [Aggregatilineales bacterium]